MGSSIQKFWKQLCVTLHKTYIFVLIHSDIFINLIYCDEPVPILLQNQDASRLYCQSRVTRMDQSTGVKARYDAAPPMYKADRHSEVGGSLSWDPSLSRAPS